jgi:hypothetical protein
MARIGRPWALPHFVWCRVRKVCSKLLINLKVFERRRKGLRVERDNLRAERDKRYYSLRDPTARWHRTKCGRAGPCLLLGTLAAPPSIGLSMAPACAQYAPPPGHYAPAPGYPPPCTAVSPGRGAVGSAARGAAAGAAFGAIGGNAGRGAAVGATMGGVAGAARRGAQRSAGQCY